MARVLHAGQHVAREDGDGVGLLAKHRLDAAQRGGLQDGQRRLNARADEDRVVGPAHGRVGRRQDPVELREPRPVQRPAREALDVLRADHEAGLLLVDGLLHQPACVTVVGAADGAVEFACDEAGDQFVRGALAHHHRNAR